MELALCHPSGAKNFEFSSRFLENLCTSVYGKPVLQYDNYVSVILNKVIYRSNTGCLQKNGAVSQVNKKLTSHLTRAQRTPSAAETVQVSHALPAVRFSCLVRGSGASFQDGVAAGKGFLCAPF